MGSAGAGAGVAEMSRLSLTVLVFLSAMTSTHIRADDAATPVTYADGRLSNGIISVLFDKQGAFAIYDAQSEEVLLSDARFGLPSGRRGDVEKMDVEDVQDVLGVGKRVILVVTDRNELRYQAAAKRLFSYALYENNPALVCGFGLELPNYLSLRLMGSRPLAGGRLFGGRDIENPTTLNGEIADFCMNDKCAAGTGRFLGAAAAALDIPIDQLGPVSLQSRKPIKITTTCTVFAESEVLAWLGKGKKIEDILWGVHKSIASRSAGLMRRVGLDSEITFSGGVSRNNGMVKALEERLKQPLNISEECHYMGALGAALFALDRVEAQQEHFINQMLAVSVTVSVPAG